MALSFLIRWYIIPNWNSEREADDFAPPAQVCDYIVERDEAWEVAQKAKHDKRCQQFIQD